RRTAVVPVLRPAVADGLVRKDDNLRAILGSAHTTAAEEDLAFGPWAALRRSPPVPALSARERWPRHVEHVPVVARKDHDSFSGKAFREELAERLDRAEPPLRLLLLRSGE